MDNYLVRMEGIEKRFPGVHALKNCQFLVDAGEVHALIGENGAGKSTLMKVLTGVHKKDGGKVFYKGQEVDIKNTREAQDLGIQMIHQELNLMPDLTVAENIFIGKEPRKIGGLVCDDKTMNRETKKLLDSMNISIDPTTVVDHLTVAQQQMVEIAKALSYDSELLIMDEPTAALTDSEINELFRIIRELKAKGVGIVYISHRMEELKAICDSVTVMRDGEFIGRRDMEHITIDEIIHMMVGREIFEEAHLDKELSHGQVVLEAKHLNRGSKVRDVSFKLRKGEILGLAGLMGAGRTEVARCIFGADKLESGQIFLNGKEAKIKSPKEAVASGIGYLSEDRKRYGLVLGLDIESNIAMADMSRFISSAGTLKTNDIEKNAQKHIDALDIKTPGSKQLVKNLSGGNQQKVVIGKWLTRNCDILIFDEPTRGIDVGAKSEIYKLLNELADQGKSIIMISSELPEVLRMSHRVLVMCEGKVTGELSRSEASQESIMKCATNRIA